MITIVCMAVATWYAIMFVFLNSCILVLFVFGLGVFGSFFWWREGAEGGGGRVGIWIFCLVGVLLQVSLPRGLFIHLHHFVAKIRIFLGT